MHENTGDNQGWHTVSDEFYVRDVSGKEIAIYSGTNLVQWNIWGLDNVGKINSDTTRNYYLKDHLGSVHVVLNSTNQVISAQDYDAWGYPLENRTYNATAMKYDFTGKERDDQTSYDYFGARYYDSRVANWTSIDPLFEKHFDFSPFNYVLRNPVRLIDPDGRQDDAIFGVGVAAVASAVQTSPAALAIYGTYELADYLSDKYIEYNTDAKSNSATQNIIESTNDLSGFKVLNSKSKGIESHLNNIELHLKKWDKTFPSPQKPDPKNWKGFWTTTIITALENIGKKVNSLDRNSIFDLLHQFNKWKDPEKIMKLMERVKEKGIDPSEFIKLN